MTSEEVPCSVNASIILEDYPVKMIQTSHVLRRVNECGPNSALCKVDWADGQLILYLICHHSIISLAAYKNCPIAQEDVFLQASSLGGRYFLESSATFGASSSPGQNPEIKNDYVIASLQVFTTPQRRLC